MCAVPVVYARDRARKPICIWCCWAYVVAKLLPKCLIMLARAGFTDSTVCASNVKAKRAPHSVVARPTHNARTLLHLVAVCPLLLGLLREADLAHAAGGLGPAAPEHLADSVLSAPVVHARTIFVPHVLHTFTTETNNQCNPPPFTPSAQEYNPTDRSFTWRAVFLGSAAGSLIAISNMYLGLKSGITIGATLFATLLGGVCLLYTSPSPRD